MRGRWRRGGAGAVRCAVLGAFLGACAGTGTGSGTGGASGTVGAPGTGAGAAGAGTSGGAGTAAAAAGLPVVGTPAWMVPLALRGDAVVFLEQATLARVLVRDAVTEGDAARDAVTLVEPDGRKIWTVRVWPAPGAATLTAPPVPMPDGGAVLCTDRGLARVDVAGNHRWKIDAPPCIAAARGRLTPLVALLGGELRTLDQEGAPIWVAPAAGASALAVLADASVAVAGSGLVRAYDGFGRVAWEERGAGLDGPIVATTDGAAIVAATAPAAPGEAPGRVVRLKAPLPPAPPPPGTTAVPGTPAASPLPAPAHLRVGSAGRPAVGLPSGLFAVDDAGTLEVFGTDGAPRWKAACARAALVVFGEVACAAATGVRAFRADGTLMAEADFGGAAVAGALATQEWLFAVTRAADGAYALRGATRPPLPPR